MSLSSRRAWIEIFPAWLADMANKVALLTESVDWNNIWIIVLHIIRCRSPHGERGLKSYDIYNLFVGFRSLSSRRAWIEIGSKLYSCIRSFTRRSPHGERGLKCLPISVLALVVLVALLTESVDWNLYINLLPYYHPCRSPHGERGLKFEQVDTLFNRPAVALLTESVDWNWNCIIVKWHFCNCRSPHGERGLKSESVNYRSKYAWSLSSRRAWIEIKHKRRRRRKK